MACGDDYEDVNSDKEVIQHFSSTKKDMKKCPPKPSPDGILRLCKKLNEHPKHSCMIGDSFTDMEAGFRAGCGTCIFVTEGGNSTEDFVSWLNHYFETNIIYQESTENSNITVFRIIFPRISISSESSKQEIEKIDDKIDFVVMKNVDEILTILP